MRNFSDILYQKPTSSQIWADTLFIQGSKKCAVFLTRLISLSARRRIGEAMQQTISELIKYRYLEVVTQTKQKLLRVD